VVDGLAQADEDIEDVRVIIQQRSTGHVRVELRLALLDS
jgi:hypothetical protein